MGNARSFVVSAEEAGSRLDRLLVRRLTGLSRRGARAMLEAGCVSVDAGRRGAPRVARVKAQRVEAGDEIIVQRCEEFVDPASQPPVPGAVEGVQVLHEEPSFLVLHKPAGIPSHPLRPFETGTVANAVAARYEECVAVGGSPREAGLCHRLDTLTSGLLVVARSPEAYLAFRSAFWSHRVEKRYLALVLGRPPEVFSVAAFIRNRRGRRRVQVGSGGLEAETAFRRVRGAAAASLVEARTRFGRRHQVRAHLAHAGHPLVGDALYGGEALPGWPGPPLLHASRMAFPHPQSGEQVVFEDPLPEAMRPALDGLLPPPPGGS